MWVKFGGLEFTVVGEIKFRAAGGVAHSPAVSLLYHRFGDWNVCSLTFT